MNDEKREAEEIRKLAEADDKAGRHPFATENLEGTGRSEDGGPGMAGRPEGKR